MEIDNLLIRYTARCLRTIRRQALDVLLFHLVHSNKVFGKPPKLEQALRVSRERAFALVQVDKYGHSAKFAERPR